MGGKDQPLEQPATFVPRSGPPAEVTLVHWRRLETPLGPLHVAATPAGVVSVSTDGAPDEAFLRRLEEDLGVRAYPVAGRADPLLSTALAEIAAYFAGEQRTFSVPLDLRLLPGVFNRKVLLALRAVPWGHLVSYSELARRVEAPRAARAVGHACAVNPLPILIPCHRVVHANGGIGGYGGAGIAYKRALLAIEDVHFSNVR